MEIGSPEWKGIIIDGAKTLDIRIDDKASDLFALHGIELMRWAKKTNLTAITDPLEVAIKHFIDSIAAAPFISPGNALLDIGSGGGFPGLPLKVVMPALRATLIDGSRKKVSFLNHVIRTLGIHQTEAIQIRAEELAKQQKFSGAFDIVICRAFSSLTLFIKRALPLLVTGGKLIALRGKITDGDIQSLRAFSLPYTIQRYRLPYLNAERSLVILG